MHSRLGDQAVQLSVEEPLAESAPLAHRLAQEHCRKDPASGESCAWYHGFWQYARLLGLGTSPELHAAFLCEALAGAGSPGKPLRVLIAGAADYSMLAYVLAICRASGIRPQVAVADWCETPLLLSRWYAERVSQPLATFRRNLLEAPEAAQYDLVCTHALLGHFRPDERPALLAGWHRALRPGGRVVTLNRLRPGAGDGPARFTAEQARGFSEAVRRGAEALRARMPVDPEALARDAARYAERQLSWPVGSVDELRALFERAGFTLEHLSAARLAPSGGAPFNVPTVPGSAEYGRVVALKP